MKDRGIDYGLKKEVERTRYRSKLSDKELHLQKRRERNAERMLVSLLWDIYEEKTAHERIYHKSTLK